MTQENTKKIVRFVLQGPLINAADELMKHYELPTTQDLLKLLISNDIRKLKDMSTRYGTKKKDDEEEGPKPPSIDEQVEAALSGVTDEMKILGYLATVPGYLDPNASYSIRHNSPQEYESANPPVKYPGPKSFLHWSQGNERADLCEVGKELIRDVKKHLKEHSA